MVAQYTTKPQRVRVRVLQALIALQFAIGFGMLVGGVRGPTLAKQLGSSFMLAAITVLLAAALRKSESGVPSDTSFPGKLARAASNPNMAIFMSAAALFSFGYPASIALGEQHVDTIAIFFQLLPCGIAALLLWVSWRSRSTATPASST